MGDTIISILLIIIIIMFFLPLIFCCGILSMGSGVSNSSENFIVHTLDTLFSGLYKDIDESVQFVEQITMEFYNDAAKAVNEGVKDVKKEAKEINSKVKSGITGIEKTITGNFDKKMDEIKGQFDKDITILKGEFTEGIADMNSLVSNTCKQMENDTTEGITAMEGDITKVCGTITNIAKSTTQDVLNQCDKIIDTVGSWFGI